MEVHEAPPSPSASASAWASNAHDEYLHSESFWAEVAKLEQRASQAPNEDESAAASTDTFSIFDAGDDEQDFGAFENENVAADHPDVVTSMMAMAKAQWEKPRKPHRRSR